MDNIHIDQVKAELCRRSFYYFFKEFWGEIIHEEPIYNWHIEYLCNELQEVVQRVVLRLPKESDIVINVPPGSTKSTIATVMLNAWVWTIDPTIRMISGSYSAGLSIEQSIKTRDILRSDKYGRYFPNLVLKSDKDNKTNYENTQGGQRVSTSVGGTITGLHAHIIVIDDPINPTDALSSKKRKTANTWMSRTLSGRKVDKAVTVTILIMQRLHEEDPAGQWLKKDKPIKHICLPSESSDLVKPSHLKKFYKGGLLDPVRMSRAILDEQKTDLGSYAYAGQFEQSPAPEGGGMIKEDWYQYFTMSELRTDVYNTAIDTAYTDDEENDPSVILKYIIQDNNLYILNVIVEYLEFPELVKKIEREAHPKGMNYVEPKASGKSVVQYLKRKRSINIKEDTPPVESKVARLAGHLPFIESGNVYLLKNALYLDQFIGETTTFPASANDDQVDALVIALGKLSTPSTWGEKYLK